MQHLIFLSFQYRKYSNCYIIALQYFLKYGSAIIQQLLHLIFLFLQVEHIAIAILLHCNILIILQCNNIAIAIFSLSSFKLQFYRILFTPANIFLGPSLGGVQKKYFIGLTLKCQISRGTSVITWRQKPPHSLEKTAPLF